MQAEEARRSAVPRISRPAVSATEGLAMKEGDLRLVVRSRRVARLVEFDVPLFTPYGGAGSRTRRATVHDYVLDERQQRAVTQARELAARVGLAFEVTDLSKDGAVGRLRRAGSAILGRSKRRVPRAPVSSGDGLP